MCLTLACVALQLITVIRQDLNLTKSGVSGANVAAITGTIFARVAMGSFCDAFGPRLGHAFLLSCSSTAGAKACLMSQNVIASVYKPQACNSACIACVVQNVNVKVS
jgi:nitrate/nitrite transporter NarK